LVSTYTVLPPWPFLARNDVDLSLICTSDFAVFFLLYVLQAKVSLLTTKTQCKIGHVKEPLSCIVKSTWYKQIIIFNHFQSMLLCLMIISIVAIFIRNKVSIYKTSYDKFTSKIARCLKFKLRHPPLRKESKVRW